ncbi:MAG: ROK family transcriptional regulator [Verrucomicrobiae bacterium]|nr:ROK family transcriptional regulator [Verrucomicrobiae bacterium]
MDPATLERLIVKEIRKAREISRRDLADRLVIAKSTAGRRIDSMIERGIVRETGIEDRKEVGRPRRFLDLVPSYGSYAGFDFDARHLYAVLIDYAQGELSREKIRLSSAPNRDELLGHLRNLIAGFRENASGMPLHAVGIGVPGHVRRESRTSVYYPFISDWHQVDLATELDLEPSLLHIENNTRAILLGEYWNGPLAGSENLACINVRTGIAAAVIANGALISGEHEMAGEIRGWPVSEHDWLEKVATVRAVIDGEAPGSDRWFEFVTACLESDPASLATLEEAATHHGAAAARIVQLLDPKAVFFAGPFTELESLYLDRVRNAVAASLDGHYFTSPPILAASLGEYAGAHGAAALAAAETPLPDTEQTV